MDWKIVLTTFAAVFVAEVADKTQLVGIAMASKTMNPVSVLTGSVAAYIVITAVSVFLGSALGHWIKPEILRVGGAVLFIAIGILMFFDKI